MNTHPDSEFEISLDDEDTEHLTEQPDLPDRHNASFAAAPEADDLPVLTDVVDERPEPFIGESAPIILEPVQPEPSISEAFPPVFAAQPGQDELAERLVALDTAISRHIEDWVANELPQLISRELDELAERLSHKAAAHLRASLLPLVSSEIADTLDSEPQA